MKKNIDIKKDIVLLIKHNAACCLWRVGLVKDNAFLLSNHQWLSNMFLNVQKINHTTQVP